ncbi:hypothetical protein J6590_022664 [Homalodisca vitripennis]|nr:hypothetical protein J6590_022664 [Homalodisca vitripennis]
MIRLRSSQEGYRPPAQLHEATDQDEGPALHGSDTTSAHLCGPSMVQPHLQDRTETAARCPERLSPAGHWVALVREEHCGQGFVQCPHHQEFRGRPDIEPRRSCRVLSVGSYPSPNCVFQWMTDDIERLRLHHDIHPTDSLTGRGLERCGGSTPPPQSQRLGLGWYVTWHPLLASQQPTPTSTWSILFGRV